MTATAQRASGPPSAAALDLARPGWVLDLLFALSIWNLNFMRGWREMIFASAADQYWTPLPKRVDYIALLLLVLGGAALSFLGLGLRPPITSWGVLLSEAQNMNAVALYPWLLTPVVMVVLTVLAFNFLGDGLRDAADPYS